MKTLKEKNKINITPVILSGGAGTRLWPLSRTGYPKQYLSLTGNESLFQKTAIRLSKIENTELKISPVVIVASEEHRFLVNEQLKEVEIKEQVTILEPEGKNTAAALTLAALYAEENDEEQILIVTPADHVIENEEEFSATIQKAISIALTGQIVILGVKPQRAETGYGYIQVANKNKGLHDVLKFTEKPDSVKAAEYLEKGGYFWNAGIFILKSSTWLKNLFQYRPDILETTQKAWNFRSVENLFLRPNPEYFKNIPSESIDYAVIEPASLGLKKIKMLTLDAGWNDVGAWDAVWEVLPKDSEGNATKGDVVTILSKNCLVHASSRQVSLVGVDELVVIETVDAVLVAKKSNSQDVKSIIKILNENGRKEHELNRKVHRPWGWYDSIDNGEQFKVKRIHVKPGRSISLQMHHHRAEHWIVVKGIAEVIIGNKTDTLCENQSTFIPVGEKHRLINPGKTPLEIIEVQTGSLLSESDIVRFEDEYGRK